MRIVMDFDGVYTDPTAEGEECSKNFRLKLLTLRPKVKGLDNEDQVDSWLGELRARLASHPFRYGWRSEGRISAFTFEDPFIRNIGLADFLDHLAKEGDSRAKGALEVLRKSDNIESFGDLSTWSFHQLNIKKIPDPGAKAWVMNALEKGHEVTIVSNSATDKIQEFLDQAGFPKDGRPKVRGGAKKFGLGKSPKVIKIGAIDGVGVEVDTDRPVYQEALLELKPDLVIGDVFCLDLSLPIRLKREGKLEFRGGIYYRHRDYTPSPMVDLVSGRGTLVPEVTLIRDWDQVKLN